MLEDFASSMVCWVASVAVNALMILVAKGLSGLNTSSLALVALSKAVLATLTACSEAFALVS